MDTYFALLFNWGRGSSCWQKRQNPRMMTLISSMTSRQKTLKLAEKTVFALETIPLHYLIAVENYQHITHACDLPYKNGAKESIQFQRRASSQTDVMSCIV